MIKSINNILTDYQNRLVLPMQQTQSFSRVSNVFKGDSYSFCNVQPIASNPTASQPANNTSFFNNPGVRVTGTLLGTAAIGGGIGYAIGSACGRAGLGASIGMGIGIIAPIAVMTYFLFQLGKN